MIHSKAEIGAAHLRHVMEQKDIWLFGELLAHPDLKYFTPDLSVMIDFFVEKGIVQVEPIETKGQKIYHRGYFVKKILTHEYYDGILLNVANEQLSCFERKADKKKF